MTLADLKLRLARLLGLENVSDDPVFSAWSSAALNDAMGKLSAQLQIPRKTYTLSSVVDSATAPSDMQTWGLLAANDMTNGTSLAIIDPARRMSRFPEAVTAPPTAVEYDVANNRLTLWPKPPSKIDLLILYAAVPQQMVADTDVPFNGQYDEFHYIIAFGAALLVHEGDWGDPQRVDWVRKRYIEELAEFVARVNTFNKSKPRSEVEIDPQRA